MHTIWLLDGYCDFIWDFKRLKIPVHYLEWSCFPPFHNHAIVSRSLITMFELIMTEQHFICSSMQYKHYHHLQRVGNELDNVQPLHDDWSRSYKFKCHEEVVLVSMRIGNYHYTQSYGLKGEPPPDEYYLCLCHNNKALLEWSHAVKIV